MMTDYELALMKPIPIPLHLINDYLVGALLLAAPWLFRFSALRLPTSTLIVAELLIIGLTATTQPAGRPRKIMA